MVFIYLFDTGVKYKDVIEPGPFKLYSIYQAMDISDIAKIWLYQSNLFQHIPICYRS